MKLQIKCKECGKDFKVIPAIFKRKGNRFCSQKCMGIWRSKNYIKEKHPSWKGGKVEKICKQCNKEFKVIIALSKNRKFCSAKCMGIWQSINRSKENHPSWKGGPIKRICKICGNNFFAAKCHIKRGGAFFCSSSCRAIWQISCNKKQNTSIEIKMEQELIRRGIVFQKQYPIWQAKTIPDFFIPPNICIYCDGDYWHNLPNMKLKDRQQDFILKFLGYKVYRFWEHEINKNIAKCLEYIRF